MSRAATNINAERLEQLAGDPRIKSGDIARILGVGRANFFSYLSQNEALWNVYETARTRAGRKVNKSHLKTRRGILAGDEIKILEAIARSGHETYANIRAAVLAQGVEPARFAVLMYNLEHEKHEIESLADGQVTRYRIRVREKKEAA